MLKINYAFRRDEQAWKDTGAKKSQQELGTDGEKILLTDGLRATTICSGRAPICIERYYAIQICHVGPELCKLLHVQITKNCLIQTSDFLDCRQ